MAPRHNDDVDDDDDDDDDEHTSPTTCGLCSVHFYTFNNKSL